MRTTFRILNNVFCLLTAVTTLIVQAQANNNIEHFLIGTFTEATSEGVYLVSLDKQNQTLINKGVVAKDVNPSYLALTASQNTLFASTGGHSGGLSMFQWQPKQQAFKQVAKDLSLGGGACHIALHPEQSIAAISTYGGGEVALYDWNVAESKVGLKAKFKNSGKSITARQEAPHMHYAQWDHAGKYLYAVDLGTDEVLKFSTFKDLQPTTAAKLPAGDGPRHMVFHPNLDKAYVLTELSNYIVAYQQNPQDGSLTEIQRISALPADIKKGQYGSAIKVSADGKFLYAAIRGINKIAVFAIDDSGLTLLQHVPTGGNWPRDFTFSAEQDYMLIANKRQSLVTVLARDIETGLLTPTEMFVEVSVPSAIALFANDHLK